MVDLIVFADETPESKVAHDMLPFFEAMIKEMARHYPEKGDSWKTLPWSYLMDKLCVQIEDMQNRSDEDFYANIGNYGAMLWLNDKAGRFESINCAALRRPQDE